MRSEPIIAPVEGLLISAPVLWFEPEPMGDFSCPWLGVDGVLGLSPEPSEGVVLEGLVGTPPEPGEEVDVPEPVGALSRPPAVLLEPEPAGPESLLLELPVPEPAKPVSLPLELPPVPEPAKGVSLPLELPVPEPARPFPPALELGVPGLVFAKPLPAVLKPEAPADVGLVSVPGVLPGRFEEVLRPLPALELGAVVAVWLGREDSAPETGLTGVPEGLESKLELGCRLPLASPPVAGCEAVGLAELGELVSRLELAVPPPANPFVSGARLAPAAPALNGLLESAGCAALERTLASCSFSAPAAAPFWGRTRFAEFNVLEPPAFALIFSALPVLVTLERNKLGLATLAVNLGKLACCAALGASSGERCCNLITCEELGLGSFNGGCSVFTMGFGNGLETVTSAFTRGVTALTTGATGVLTFA